jgi:hypothetical protein
MTNLSEFDPLCARGPTRALNRTVTYHSTLPPPLLNGPAGSFWANSFEIEYRIVRAEGCDRRLYDRGIFIRDVLNAITRVVGVAGDISEWKYLQGMHRPKPKLSWIAHNSTIKTKFVG